jgi:hypothetical protein
MSPRIVIALSVCGAFVACGGPESLRAIRGAAGTAGAAGMGLAGNTGNPGTAGGAGNPGTSGDIGPVAGMGGDPGTAGVAPTGGTGGTPPATGGMGGTPATGGMGGTPATGGMGGTPATGGSGGKPATGGSGGTPATGGSGGTPATGGTGGTPATGGSGGAMVGGGPSIKLDSGSLVAMGAWGADADFAPAPGTTNNHANPIDVSKVTNPAPAAVYQTARSGTNFTYTVPGYKANTMHTVRLHFCETYFPVAPATAGAGLRVCNITINGNAVLPGYDIFVKAGGKNIAIAEQLVLAADATGQYVMSFVRMTDNCFIAGIEID